MLLNDLLKLFSSSLNINEERFITIIEANNIKLSQRLLCKPKDTMKIANNSISDSVNNISNESKNISESAIISNISNSSNISTTSNLDANLKKKESSGRGRGRGRPKKTKEIVEEDSVIVEVELITLDNIEYYKTNENVLLNKQMEIEGILKNGKLVKHDMD